MTTVLCDMCGGSGKYQTWDDVMGTTSMDAPYVDVKTWKTLTWEQVQERSLVDIPCRTCEGTGRRKLWGGK